jgi:drug/metabolite transporter (DMT)-like permease
MNSKSDPRWAYPLVNLATLLWATNFALGRLFRNEIGPFTLTAARFTVAAIILSIWGSRLPAQERAPGRQSALLFDMGLTGVFGFGWLLYSGLQHTTVTNAALMNGTAPLIIGLLAALLLKERFSPQSILGAIISLSGVAVIVSGGSLEVLLRQQWNVGDLLVLAAVADWGMYSILARVVTRSRSTISATWLSTLLGLPLLYISAAWEWQTRPPTLDLPVMVAVIYIGIFPSVVAFLAWNEGVRRVGPSRVTAFYNMLPVFGALIGVVWLGESFGLAQLIGGGLIIAGSLTAVWTDLQGPRSRYER